MRRISIIAFAVAALAGVVAPASAQERWSLDATVGPSFGSIGTTFAAGGALNVPVNDRVSVVGELGVLPNASASEADGLVSPLPGRVPTSDVHVNAYNVNANVRVRGNDYFRFTPYVTAGVGAFTADTVGRQELVDAGVSEWTRRTDLATNVGAGVTYRLSEHLGLNADWRTFFVNGDNDVERVNRFTTGFSVSLR
jgi:opacity protein-like surface antigen